jgi:hypothetical protein
MADDLNLVDTILELVRQIKATLFGLKQLRSYVGKGVGQQMLELLIEESETKLAEIRRRLIQ